MITWGRVVDEGVERVGGEVGAGACEQRVEHVGNEQRECNAEQQRQHRVARRAATAILYNRHQNGKGRCIGLGTV